MGFVYTWGKELGRKIREQKEQEVQIVPKIEQELAPKAAQGPERTRKSTREADTANIRAQVEHEKQVVKRSANAISKKAEAEAEAEDKNWEQRIEALKRQFVHKNSKEWHRVHESGSAASTWLRNHKPLVRKHKKIPVVRLPKGKSKGSTVQKYMLGQVVPQNRQALQEEVERLKAELEKCKTKCK